MTSEKDRLKPVIERFQEIGARFCAEWIGRKDVPLGEYTKWSLYLSGDHFYLLEVLPGGHGWNVWKPVDDSNSVAEALAAIV